MEKFDKNLLCLYREGEAEKNLNNIKKDWRFVKEDSSFMHKTGLKFFLESDEKSGRIYVVEDNVNFNGWKNHMNRDCGLKGLEIELYRRRLFQEFKVFVGWYTNEIEKQQHNMQINASMLPYLIAQSMKNPDKS